MPVDATDSLRDEDRLARLAASLSALTGWRRAATLIALGALATLALPPLSAVPVLFVAFPALIWVLSGVRGGWGAFAAGWCFGFGHHLIGLYWISFALFTDIDRFWWAVPFSAAGLPVLLSLFTGAATLAAWALARRGVAAPLALAVAWSAAEWLRGHAFTGFPWNLTGYTWVGMEPVLQGAALVGIYGLGFVTVLVAGLPALLADERVPRPRALAAVAAGLAVLLAVGVWGALRLPDAPSPTVPGVRLRLVQPAIDQRLKWAPGERDGNLQRHLELSAQPASRPVTHVIWAETAVAFFLEQDASRRMGLAAVTPPGGLTITGVPRVRLGADGGREFTNGLIAVDGGGRVTATYDKFHLVPFGEYVPFRHLLPFGPIAGDGAEFTPGPGPQTLALAGLPPVSPLICYEVIFPGAVVDPTARPQWLLNLTNDAWYGRSAGPHQHFAIARVRAVEEGLPLVRVANTGISGVVDAYGRVTARLELGYRGVLDADLPTALPEPPPYARWGDGPFGVILLGSLALGALTRHRRTDLSA